MNNQTMAADGRRTAVATGAATTGDPRNRWDGRTAVTPIHDRDIVDSSWDIPLIDFGAVSSQSAPSSVSTTKCDPSERSHSAKHPGSRGSVIAGRVPHIAAHASAKPQPSPVREWCAGIVAGLAIAVTGVVAFFIVL